MDRIIGIAGICLALVLSSAGLVLHIKNLESLSKESEDYKYRHNDCVFMIVVALGVALLMLAMLIDTAFPSVIPFELGF